MRVSWSRLRGQFWALPLLCAAAAAGAALALGTVDRSLDTGASLPFLFSGGPDGARALLSAIVASMISFTGLVFSITIVVLQLASTQFSPRVLRTFLRDRFTQLSLGVFVATFVYALVVLRSVHGTARIHPFVPQLSVTLAFGFVLASVVVFLGYIHHMAQSIRVSTIISNIARETREVIERRYPLDACTSASPTRPHGLRLRVCATRPGVLLRIDVEALVRIAEKHDATICLLRTIGEFVPDGAPLFDIYGEKFDEVGKLRRAVELGDERSMDDDPGFGLRQLVDVAERALSPGVNDPTTAVQVTDQLHDLLRRIATRGPTPQQWLTSAGRLAVEVPAASLSDHLRVAVDELSHWAEGEPRVQRRIRIMLYDLIEAARPEYRSALRDALARRTEPRPPDESWLSPSDIGLR